ncbi:MAG: hypothetical protein ACQKBY_05795 [Verrucomicrobiales bacterium]
MVFLFNPQADEAPESGPWTTLEDERKRILTEGNLALLLGEEDAKKVAPYTVYSLPETFVQPLVPRGKGYASAGEAAKDLNELVAARDVDGIADHIQRHLPEFEGRKGGFPNDQDYLKTLAASIIDYADEDSDATVGAGYRGVDSYPFVNEIYDRYVWRPGGSARNPTIEVRTFVELWNPTHHEITGQISLENINLHRIESPGGGASEPFGPLNLELRNPVTIEPNGYKVVELVLADGSKPTYEKNYNFNPPVDSGGYYFVFDNTYDSSYKLFWNGREVDWARGGMWRTNGTLRQGESQRKWKGQASVALQMDWRASDIHGRRNVGIQYGDPRASTYIDTPIYANTFSSNSNFGGRAKKNGIGNSNYNEVKYSRWPDGGHDGNYGRAMSDSRIPTVDASEQQEPELAVAHISNEGRYQSLGELGNIFDPAQWRDITVADGNGEESRCGGGATLAIGREEFAVFDNEDWRAAQLLDLFYLRNPDTTLGIPTGLQELKGKININTAPREVLRALFADLLLNDDPGERAGGAVKKYFPPKSSGSAHIADLIVEAIIEQRQEAPFMALSDLAALKLSDGRPAFGNRDLWLNGSRPSDEWDDRGREALFAKVANLVTFRSRCFRVYVTGQLLDADGKVLGSRSKVMGFSVEPARDTDGSIQPNQPAYITNFYERSM